MGYFEWPMWFDTLYRCPDCDSGVVSLWTLRPHVAPMRSTIMECKGCGAMIHCAELLNCWDG